MAMRDSDSDPQENLETTEHADDAVIGRAFKWSAIAFALIVVVAGVLIFIATRPPEQEAEQITTIVAPENPEQLEAIVPRVTFTDITQESGIEFTHNSGASGEKLLPETMGGGVAFFDYDADGDQDLLFVNGTSWSHSDSQNPTTAQLFQNDGTGKFSNVTAGSGLDVPLYGMGTAIADYDQDGLPDVYLTAVGQNRLFKNKGGGKFEDVTSQAGCGGAASLGRQGRV